MRTRSRCRATAVRAARVPRRPSLKPVATVDHNSTARAATAARGVRRGRWLISVSVATSRLRIERLSRHRVFGMLARCSEGGSSWSVTNGSSSASARTSRDSSSKQRGDHRHRSAAVAITIADEALRRRSVGSADARDMAIARRADSDAALIAAARSRRTVGVARRPHRRRRNAGADGAARDGRRSRV